MTAALRIALLAVAALALPCLWAQGAAQQSVVRAINQQDWAAAQQLLDQWQAQAEPAMLNKYRGILRLLRTDTGSKQQNLTRAEPILLPFLKDHPDDWEVAQLLIQAHSETGNGKRATELLRAFVRANPNHVAALVSMANFHAQDQQPKQALNHLIRAAELAPGTTQIWTRIADLHKLLGQTQQAEQALWQGVKHQPENKEVWGALSNQLLAAKDYQKALLAIDILARVNPRSESAHYPTLAMSGERAALIVGTLLGHIRPDADAIGNLSIPAEARQVLRWSAQERTERLPAHLEQWLNRQPESPWAHSLQGYQYMLAGEYRKAQESLARALQYSENLKPALLLTWHLHQITGDARGALTVAEKMHARQPKQLVWAFRHARALFMARQYEEAVAAYRRALNEFSEHPFAWTDLVESLLQLGKRREAVSAYLQAERAMPGLPNILFEKIALPEGL